NAASRSPDLNVIRQDPWAGERHGLQATWVEIGGVVTAVRSWGQLLAAVGGEALAVAGPLDDDLVAGVGQAVQGSVPQDRVGEQREPFVHRPIAGDGEAGLALAVDDELVEVDRLLGAEALQAEVVQDEQVGR